MLIDRGACEPLLRIGEEKDDRAVVDGVTIHGEERAGDFMEVTKGDRDVDTVCFLTGVELNDLGSLFAKDVSGVDG